MDFIPSSRAEWKEIIKEKDQEVRRGSSYQILNYRRKLFVVVLNSGQDCPPRAVIWK